MAISYDAYKKKYSNEIAQRHETWRQQNISNSNKKKKEDSFLYKAAGYIPVVQGVRQGVNLYNGIKDVITDPNETFFNKNAEGSFLDKVRGTQLDTIKTSTQSILGQYEGMSDWGYSRIADVLDFFGDDNQAKHYREEAAKDYTSEIIEANQRISQGDLSSKKSKEELEKDDLANSSSVLGGKSRNIVSGTASTFGNLILSSGIGGASVGLGDTTRNVLGVLPMYLSAAGTGEQEALNAGATRTQARYYGALSGFGEAGSELMFGAFGKGAEKLGFYNANGMTKGALDDVLINRLTGNIKNIAAKNGMDWILRAGGEGLEELANAYWSAVAKKVTFKNEEDLEKLIDDEKPLEQFLNGMASAAVSGLPGNVMSTISGTETGTGITKNENKVVEAVVEERTKGQNLTKKEINQVRQQVREQLMEGTLTTQEIDRAVGDEEIKATKEDTYLMNRFRAEQSQFVLDNEEQKQANGLSNETRKSLLSDLQGVNNTTEVHQIVRDIIEAQKLNTTQKFHPITTEGLYKMGLVNKDANGNYTLPDGSPYVPRGLNYINGDIYVNLDVGAKSGKQAMYHEMFEAFKKASPENYQELKNLVEEIVGKETIDQQLEQYRQMYERQGKQLTDDVRDEIINDQFGEIAENQDFINRIAENRNLLQRFIDAIKEFIAKIKGTPQEKSIRQLQKNLENKFAELYKDTDFSQNAGETALSIVGIEGINNLPDSSLKNAMLEKYNIANEMKNNNKSNNEIFEKTKFYVGQDGKLRTEISDNMLDLKISNNIKDGQTYKLDQVIDNDYLFSFYPELRNYDVKITNYDEGFIINTIKKVLKGNKPNGSYQHETKTIFLNENRNTEKAIKQTLIHEIQHAIQHIEGFEAGTPSILSSENYIKSNGENEAKLTSKRLDLDKQQRKENPFYLEQEKQTKERLNNYYKNRSMFDKFKDKIYNYLEGKIKNENSEEDGFKIQENNTGNNISVYEGRLKGVDNASFSLTSNTDNQGRQLSEQQQEYFKDSKVRDDEGRLLEVYHGSPKEFTKFETSNQWGYGGSYFTSDLEVAQNYGNNNYKSYLNLTNPLIIDANGKMYDNIEFNGQNMDTQEIIAYARENGYDGLIVNNVIEANKLTNDYIAFEPEQIKNVDNTNPTSNPDIRYSISKQGKLQENGQDVTLETSDTGTTGSLMAIHNLGEGKLNGILDLGGFPVPSIAVTNPSKINHNQFGEISVLFDKSTIDPANRLNEVYDRDVWTPTFPTIEYDLNTKVIEKARKAVGGYGNSYLSNANSFLNNVEDKVNRQGLENVIEDLKDNKDFKYVYYKSLNPNFELLTKQDSQDLSTDYSNAMLEEFAKEYGEVPLWSEATSEQRNEIVNRFLEKLIPQLEERANKIIAEEQAKEKPRMFIIGMAQSTVDNIKEKSGALGWQDTLLQNLNKIQNEGTTRTVNDYEATSNFIEENIDQKQYEKWIDELFNGLVAKKGIYNGKEYLTSSGNRRSFNQLHEDYNLQNLVKILTAQKTVAGEQGFGAGTGFGTIQAQMNNQFKSIEDIKNAENRIVENAGEITNQYRELIGNDMEKLGEYLKYKSEYSYLYDSAGTALNDFAGYKNLNMTNLNKALENNNIDSKKVPLELKQKIIDDISSLKDLPTDYFEAKPQRAVGLNEIQQVVIPNNLSAETKQRLQEMGIPYTEYDPSIEGDRQRVINQFDDLKFSLTSNQNINQKDIAPVRNDYNLGGTQNIIQQELAPVKEQINQLQDAIEELKPITEQEADLLPTNENIEEPTIERPQEIAPTRQTADEMLLPTQQATRETEVKNKRQIEPRKKSKLRQAYETAIGGFVNRNVLIDDLSKRSKNTAIKHKGDMWSNYMGEGQSNISNYQTDINGNAIGEGVNKIFDDAEKVGIPKAVFNEFLIDYSNIDRWRNNKGSQTPYEESARRLRDYAIKYPQIKQHAQKVWKYGENSLQNRVDAGLMSKETAQTLRELYPHYVPYISQTEDIDTYYKKLNELKPLTIKRARGGAGALLPVQEALAQYTMSEKKSIRQNALFNEIIDTIGEGNNFGADEKSDYTGMTDSLFTDENGAYLTAYKDGKQRTATIDMDLYNELSRTNDNQVKDIEERLSLITNPLQKVSEIRRNVLTTWSPSFVFKNAIKDIQEAVFNSKYTKDMLKNYLPAFKELRNMNTKEAQQFVSLYGSGLTQGEFLNDTINESTRNVKGLSWLKNVNEIVELAPRYAEFKASLQNGATLEEAMYNAREVTTNFGRGGTIAKALNRNGFTFLNSSIQGFDKLVRNFSGENGAKGVAASLAKAVMFGIVPAVFNELAFGSGDDKDEEYEALPDYIKDNYYLIKFGDENFIRIPKGRVLSIFGSAARRTIETAEGEEGAFDGFLENAWSQTGVNNPAENNIFAPLIQAHNNKAWYGGDIVPSRLQDKPTEEQYDASVDNFSIWLGKTISNNSILRNTPIIKEFASPYKANYILDQYTGGIGDIALPMITEEAKSNGSLLAPVVDQFTADSTTDNKYVSDFYSKKEEITKLANGSKATDEEKLQKKYLDGVSLEMSELYKERREVQADKSLSKKEKYEKSQNIKKEINKLAKEGLDNYQNVSVSGDFAEINGNNYQKGEDGKWKKVKEKTQDDTKTLGLTGSESNSYVKTTENIKNIKDTYSNSTVRKNKVLTEIKNSNLPKEAKLQLYKDNYKDQMVDNYMDLGMDINSYLDYKTQDFTADKDKYGKAISGSKKQKVFDYINNMNIPFEQKIMLAKQEYPNYDEYNQEIIDYLNKNNNIDYNEMEKILLDLGFKVDEQGNISW